jgi:hypothetical protein
LGDRNSATAAAIGLNSTASNTSRCVVRAQQKSKRLNAKRIFGEFSKSPYRALAPSQNQWDRLAAVADERLDLGRCDFAHLWWLAGATGLPRFVLICAPTPTPDAVKVLDLWFFALRTPTVTVRC